ncbi:MAG: AIR synthase-related protein [Candidatus Micrarchaeota archaeon]|nr:AIR synthase-related protein [Candidatus Micrarchaeota archaeon]
MVKIIEVIFNEEFQQNESIEELLKKEFNLDFAKVFIASDYIFEKDLEQQQAISIAENILCDLVTQRYSLDSPTLADFTIAIEIRYKAAVKDNLGDATYLAIKDFLENFENKIRTSKVYYIKANITKEQLQHFAFKNLYNPLVEDIEIFSNSEAKDFYLKDKNLFIQDSKPGSFSYIPLKKDKNYLEKLSKHRLLALNLEEFKTIIKYYSNPKVIKKRAAVGLQPMPTDVELECIAQTWSEHCKHKIFNALINFNFIEGKKSKKIKIDSLFKTFIYFTTKKLKKSYILSAFVDNAGIFSISDNWAVAVKCETHNAPSALDPFGGALTGILGVNRDVLGAGLGSKPIFNTDIFCFASPFYNKELPPKVLHPKRIFQGVRAGVEKGANASGIPTINGSIIFDDRFLGRPLVFCGTAGLMPIKTKNGLKCYQKYIKPKDRIFLVGGRTGKDGIHGATFSSQHLDETSPTSAVQIGDPFTQKLVLDFLLESQQLGLHSGLTDNGAGGLSSSVGELAQITGGATIHLERCPLKYSGLEPWEIFLSESQERMTVAVPPQNAGDFVVLAKKHNVEVSDIGEFNSSGYLQVKYFDKTVLYLDVKFLHKGLPKPKLFATFKKPEIKTPILKLEEKENYNLDILELLASLNICSRENVIRQYDHEVLGMSVVKPLCGKSFRGPADGAVIQPFYDKNLGICVSNGICPKYSDYDCYVMAQLAIDEAVRNYLAVGGDMNHWVALDNFCWPDPIKSEKNLDGDLKLGQLVRANMALADVAKHYSLPFISGKDSMKNDYVFGNIKISIPPTLLITVVGIIKNIELALTSDFKNEGDLIYLVGKTYPEMRYSEYSLLRNLDQTKLICPTLKEKESFSLYKKLSKAIQKGLLNSCHDCSDGGLAIALAECCIGGETGAKIDLFPLQNLLDLDSTTLLFSESPSRFVVSINPKNKKEFEKILDGSFYVCIGKVQQNSLKIFGKEKLLVDLPVEQMENYYKKTLEEVL